MTLSGFDGNYDGKITIKQGQGITWAIADELGLDKSDLKKISGSIWQNIMNVVDKQKTVGGANYSGGNDLNGATDKNFVVDEGNVFEFTKENWNKIVAEVSKVEDLAEKLKDKKLIIAGGENPEEVEGSEEVEEETPANTPATNTTPTSSTTPTTATTPDTGATNQPRTLRPTAIANRFYNQTFRPGTSYKNLCETINTHMNRDNILEVENYYISSHPKLNETLIETVLLEVGLNFQEKRYPLVKTLANYWFERAKKNGIDIKDQRETINNILDEMYHLSNQQDMTSASGKSDYQLNNKLKDKYIIEINNIINRVKQAITEVETPAT